MGTFTAGFFLDPGTGRPVAGQVVRVVRFADDIPLTTVTTGARGGYGRFVVTGEDAVSLLGPGGARVDLVSVEKTLAATSGTTVAGQAATFANLPDPVGRAGQAWIVADEVAMYVSDGTVWGDPIPVQGQATETAVAQAVPKPAVVAALAPVIDGRTRTGARPVGQGEIVVSALDHGIVPDGVSDGTAALQALLDTLSAGATQGAVVHFPRATSPYVIAGTVRIPRNGRIHLEQGAVVRRPAGGSTEPIFRLGANYGKLTGAGTIESLTASPWGVVLVGPRDLTVHTNVLSGEISGLTIKGVKASGNVGIRFSSSLVATGGATYQNVVRDVTLEFLGTGIYVADVANANEFHAMQMRNILDVCFDFYGNTAYRGADECAVIGGFLHASPDAIGVRMRNTVFNQVLGLRAEMGAGARAYDLDASTEMNHLVIIDNNSTPPVDLGFENIITVNGRSTGSTRRVTRTTEQPFVSTAYVEDNQLSMQIRRNTTYAFEFFLIYDATTAADAKVQVTAPAGATAHWSVDALTTSASGDAGQRSYLYRTLGQGQAIGAAGVGTKVIARVSGTVVNGATTGDLGLSLGQVVADATPLTVYAGSSLTVTRV